MGLGFIVRPAEDVDRALLGQRTAAVPFLSECFLVALAGPALIGYLAWRPVSPDEREVLQMEVDAVYRRQGVGRAMLKALLSDGAATIFLEVRMSNSAARKLYESMGFTEIGIRREYYNNPMEDAIVLRCHPC